MKKSGRKSEEFNHLSVKTNGFSLSGALLLAVILIGGYGSAMIAYLYNATQEMQADIQTMQEQALTVKNTLEAVWQEAPPTKTSVSETSDILISRAGEIIARANVMTEKAEQRIRFGFVFLVSLVLGAMMIKSLAVAREANLRKIKTIDNLIKKIENTASPAAKRSFSRQDISSQLQKTARSLYEMRLQRGKVDQSSGSLSDTTSKIGTVMGMIKHISKDINLLALNATIEAGHADKSGKRFSVVATEVKTLANQTNKACEEIETLIQNVQGVSQEVITALNTTITSVRGISEYTQEISSNTQSSQEANISYKEVIDAAQLLSEESETLGQEVECFLTGIQERL